MTEQYAVYNAITNHASMSLMDHVQADMYYYATIHHILKRILFFIDHTSSSSVMDLEMLGQRSKRKFQRSRTSFVTGQVSVLEKGD